MKRTLLTATLVAAVAMGVTTAVDHVTLDGDGDGDGDGGAVATLADGARDEDSGSGRPLAALSTVWGELPEAPGDVVDWQWYRRKGDHDGRR